MTHRRVNSRYIIFYSPLITVIDRTVFRYINTIVDCYVYTHKYTFFMLTSNALPHFI